MNIGQYLKDRGTAFTPAQFAALSDAEQPTLLLAVPGSGKTTVLVARTAVLLDGGVLPKRMLNLTFSRKSAADMSTRFTALFRGIFPQEPKFSTIHSFCLRVLRDFGQRTGRVVPALLGSGENPSVTQLLRRCLSEVSKEYADEDAIRELANCVGFCKNRMFPPGALPHLPGAPEHLGEVFALYEQHKKAAGLMDYDDMPLFAAQILRSQPAFRSVWQSRFDRASIDEAQDVSPAQFAVLRLLFPTGKGLFLVGDEDQSIYGFRGACPRELLTFAETFPDARILKMEENFRSRPELLELADAFIRRCPERYEKRLRPTRKCGGRVEQVYPESMEDGFSEVAAILRETPSGETAGLLYRNNLSAGALAEFLTEADIPFRLEETPPLPTKGPAWMLETLLRLAANPLDSDAFRRLSFKFDLDLILYQNVLLRANGRKTVPELLREAAPLSPKGGSARKMADTLESCRGKTPVQALDLLEQELQLGQFARAKAEKGDVTLRLSYEQLRSFCRRSANFAELQKRLERAAHPLAYRPEDARVFLSTIHGAKGLEYDTVLLLDCFDGILPGKSALDALAASDSTSYYEEQRLFFVAVTRAKERLILFSPPEKGCVLRDSRFFGDFFAPRRISARAALPALPDFPPGTALSHRVFGTGTAVSRDGDQLTVRFSGSNMKTISLSYCISHHLLKKCGKDFR